MQLDNYIRMLGLTSEQFGEDAGITKLAVHKYRNGKAWPNARALFLIRKATHGKVTADDFVDQFNGMIEPPVPQAKKTPKPWSRKAAPLPEHLQAEAPAPRAKAAALAVKAPPVKPAKVAAKAKRATAARAAEAAE